LQSRVQSCARLFSHQAFANELTMTLKERLTDDMKTAMRAKDAARLGTLRLLLAAIKQKEVDERRELSDADVLAILEKQLKLRKESITAFEQAGRGEQAAAERAEAEVIAVYLPAQADEAEVAAVIAAAVADAAAAGQTGGAAMGRVMAQVKAALGGRADMAELSKRVKAALS
jgi:uncharacterized protein YqeY